MQLLARRPGTAGLDRAFPDQPPERREGLEEVFEEMYRISKRVPFDMKTTEAMHYRRFLAQKHKEDGSSFRTAGVSDGRGFVFVSHRGEIFPSGFLEVSGGNVRFNTPGGTATITLTVTANDNGNTGSGGAQSANRQVALSFSLVFRGGFEDP